MQEYPQFDILSCELLRMAGKMAKFELFGTACSDSVNMVCIVNPLAPGFSLVEMDIVRLIRATSPLLM